MLRNLCVSGALSESLWTPLAFLKIFCIVHSNCTWNCTLRGHGNSEYFSKIWIVQSHILIQLCIVQWSDQVKRCVFKPQLLTVTFWGPFRRTPISYSEISDECFAATLQYCSSSKLPLLVIASLASVATVPPPASLPPAHALIITILFSTSMGPRNSASKYKGDYELSL